MINRRTRKVKAPVAYESTAGGAYHWREYRIEKFLPRGGGNDRILLLGCGDAGEKPFLGGLGYVATGLDIRPGPATDLQGDAHALPLRSGAFDVVLSMQVLEHLHSPWIAVREIARILKPGGCLVGSVAFLKPYHNSFFHMTHKGVQRLIEEAGLVGERFAGAQSVTYSLHGSLVPLGPRAFRRFALGSFDNALLGLRKMVWSVTRRASPKVPTRRFEADFPMSFETFDRLRFAPAVVFRARKPA